MNPIDASVPLLTAVRDYFSGEQREMFLIFAGSVVLTTLAVWLWMVTRSGFSVAFMVTVLSAAVLLSATAASLLVRDKAHSSSLSQGIVSPQKAEVVSNERERIEAVISKYRYYRYGAAVFAALSVVGLLLTSRGWVHGLAAGLLLLVVAQVFIDHFSEQRARRYLVQLSVFEGGSPN